MEKSYERGMEMEHDFVEGGEVGYPELLQRKYAASLRKANMLLAPRREETYDPCQTINCGKLTKMIRYFRSGT